MAGAWWERLLHATDVADAIPNSMDKYETVQGKDWEEADLREMRDRDDVLVRREGIVDWLQVEAPTSVQAQVM